MKLKQYIILIQIILFISACATYKPQFKDKVTTSSFPKNKKIAHSFFLIGDAGGSPTDSRTKALQLFETALSKSSENSTAIFLGDNIYPNGFPKKGTSKAKLAEDQLEMQIQSVENFKGNTFFIPGNHDWYSGLKGLKRQEKFIEKALGKHSFFPENGCPIKKVKVNDDIVLIVVDSQWYLTNWNKHPTINDDCEIKTRTQFFDEFEGLIKKARGKTTLVAMHHPVFSNGPHSGQFSVAQHMKPFPVLGSIKNLVRKTGGITNTDQINSHYRDLKKRLVTLAQENKKVVFLSGHEHSLEYIVQDNLRQIVSGSGSKKNATRLVGNGMFSYGANGYARLDVFTDGASYVRFYSTENNSIIYETEVLPAKAKNKKISFDTSFPKSVNASIYNNEEVKKSSLYTWLWGKRYRKDYGVKVNAPTVDLDTLFGGLTPVRKGGGNQSKSLRLKDNTGREYTMRALRKNALLFIQAVAFKQDYVKGQFDNTITEKFLLDVFAGSQPYAPFTIGELADAVNVYHSNPKLYYIPKQKALQAYNLEFGDELYMIEERVASGHGETASFGFSNKIISTPDLLQKLRKNPNHILDEEFYIRARLFDMLIGDWDRHEDQWRWATFKEKGKTIYRPIPRDRDQAFSIMDDGFVLNAATKIIPIAKVLKKYDKDLKSVKWFNLEPYPLDVALINRSDKGVWDAQVKQIVANLTDAVIDEAFSNYPTEMDKETIATIKEKLKGRLGNLQKISDDYYAYVNKYVVIKGTDKQDYFIIERKKAGDTKVTVYQKKEGEEQNIFHQRTYTCSDNKEIWIYGLDGKDVFEVSGQGDKLIPVRLIGGQNNDTYKVKNSKRVIIYDYKSKKSNIETPKTRTKLRDDYNVNTYDYKKLKNSSNQLTPTIGFNPDDGVKIGVANTTTLFGFERNPFSSIHKFKAAYYFATQGFEIIHSSEFANAIKNWNLGVNTKLTSPNYSINFFGFGNNTSNPNDIDSDAFDLDFNRVKLSEFRVAPYLSWKGDLESIFKGLLSYETIEVEQTNGRFIDSFNNGGITDRRQNFLGAEASYSFINKNHKVFPTLGIEAHFVAGYKMNLDSNTSFVYLKPSLAINHKLIASGRLVLASKVGSHINLGNDFEFFQAANLGANNGLRGYRNQRFTAKRSLYQTTDLRFVISKFKTNLIPVTLGVYGGVDYGRVWVSNDNSNKWNNSYGGGVFLNLSNFVVGNISLFNADEGSRFAFKLGFGF